MIYLTREYGSEKLGIDTKLTEILEPIDLNDIREATKLILEYILVTFEINVLNITISFNQSLGKTEQAGEAEIKIYMEDDGYYQIYRLKQS